MLKNTFCHIPGIGELNERYLWENKITSWDLASCLNEAETPTKLRNLLNCYIPMSYEAIRAGDVKFFADRLEHMELWRLLPEFIDDIAYLDIETTGLYPGVDHITTIAIYDGKKIYTYVRGKNLNKFVCDINKFKIIVTYNGKTFDVPYIQTEFNITMPQVHIDLRYLLANLGYSGGLKACEHRLGIFRDDLEGVDGFFAVLMWYHYLKKKKKRFLNTLLAYNVEDVVNLEKLLVIVFNKMISQIPCINHVPLFVNRSVKNPYRVDKAFIGMIRNEYEKTRFSFRR